MLFAQLMGLMSPAPLPHIQLFVGKPLVLPMEAASVFIFLIGNLKLRGKLNQKELIQLKGLTYNGIFQAGCLWLDLMHFELQKHNRS